MSDLFDEEFEQLVELDLKTEATEEQVKELQDDPEAWRDCLLNKLRGIERQFTERKAVSMCANTFNARRDYEAWKSGAVAYKQAVIERLSEAKTILKDQNRATSDWSSIAKDLSAIRKLLEEKLDRA